MSLQDGLLSLWDFDDNVNDGIGANNLTVNGTEAYAAAVGNLGKGFAFNGVTDLSKTAPTNLSPTDTITVGLACKISATAASTFIVDRLGGAEGFSLGITATNSYPQAALNGGAVSAIWASAVDDGNLKFIMFTYDKDAGGTTELKLYVNNTLVATADYNLPIDYSPDPNLNVGGLGGSSRLPNGSVIYQLPIWNRVLTSDEMATWYGGGDGYNILGQNVSNFQPAMLLGM